MLEKGTKEINIFIRLPNGNGCRVRASPHTTLEELIIKIKKTTLQMPQTYRFIIKGRRVKDYSMKISQLQITENFIIHIEPDFSKQKNSGKIDVALLMNGDKLVVNVFREQTVRGLKHLISHLTGINQKEQALFFLGRKLKNEETLKHYKIDSDSLISLVIKPDNQYQRIPSLSEENQIDLATSVCSLGEKKSGGTKTSLFRSDSINKKNIEEIMPYQISIKNTSMFGNEKNQKEHLNELFKSCREEGFRNSFTFNSLFESMGLMKQNQSFEQDQLSNNDDNIDQNKEINLQQQINE